MAARRRRRSWTICGAAWREVTANADIFLDTLTTERLQEHLQWKGEALDESIGTMLQRVIYHYWYHLGEAHAVRQLLGTRNLPEFVGDMDDLPYRPALTSHDPSANRHHDKP